MDLVSGRHNTPNSSRKPKIRKEFPHLCQFQFSLTGVWSKDKEQLKFETLTCSSSSLSVDFSSFSSALKSAADSSFSIGFESGTSLERATPKTDGLTFFAVDKFF